LAKSVEMMVLVVEVIDDLSVAIAVARLAVGVYGVHSVQISTWWARDNRRELMSEPVK
jgi:hypothetical protein